jgi:predicted deacetylase
VDGEHISFSLVLDAEAAERNGADMIAKRAQYLLRLDDLCPSASREGLNRFLALIEEFRIRPILAVIPDNMDPELQISEPDTAFWARMRAMETAGATIALHGYRHLCKSRGKSLVPFHRATEFAGVQEETQREWIQAGLAILRSHALNPRIWVAPRHGFDRATLRVLRQEGLDLISDGLARVPFVRDGVTWIPQQLWGPIEKRMGLWTICVHSNTAPDELVKQLRAFLARHSDQFTSVDRVMAELKPGKLSLRERVYETMALRRLKASRLRKGVELKLNAD